VISIPLRPGLGVGNNYWDLLPFGGDDALATIYHYDALVKFAALERDIAAHPEWAIPNDGEPFSTSDLTTLAAEVKDRASRAFWNDATGRFIGWRDSTGRGWDYGFTFVNLEAIHYGVASDDQARSIFAWLDGARTVAGDTSQGADVFHWRFGPRATTRRNVECYMWAWSAPEAIPWGGQVQDGGAVLGFTYFELMSRIRVLGADDALRRLREVLAWFGEVQGEGGYRKYYAKPGRGTLQGGGTAGGLGFDAEFMESALVPQVMLYGFLGAEPRPGGLRLAPALPAAWPSLTITNVRVQGHMLDITASRDEIRLIARAADGSDFALWLPQGRWEITPSDGTSPATAHDAATPLALRFARDRGFVCRRTSAR
jgi:Glycosyl hydrolase family 65, C-terminal domain